MGSYCQYFVNANCSIDVEQSIIRFANSLEKFKFKNSPTFEDWCWKKWSTSSKWDEDNLMQNLSSEFPNIMFSVSCKGDYTYKSFWLNGKCLDDHQIWVRPKFPTAKEFNDAFARIKKQEEERKAEQEKQQKETELQEAKDKLASLELEKKHLKQKLEALNNAK